MLGGFPPFLERQISGRPRAFPLALAMLPVCVIAERCQIARRVVSDRVHPAFPPDSAEDAVVDPTLQVAPKDWWNIGMVRSLFLDKLRETPAAAINDPGEPFWEISLCLLNGPHPQGECFPLDV